MSAAPSSSPSSRWTRASKRRRERLSELERDVDEFSWAERRDAVRALLAQPLLVTNSPGRILVRRHQEWLRLWFSHHAGWELSVDAEACRLVKRPAHTRDASRACRDPEHRHATLSRRGYVMLCLVLGVLSREGRQLTLKNIADRLGGLARANPAFAGHGVPLELDHRDARRDLVHALRVLLHWNVLQRVEGREDGYVQTDTVDVLYNVNRPILARLMAARQPPSLVDAADHAERLRAIHHGPIEPPTEEGRGREIRFGLFRRLLDDPVLYYEDLADDERAYLESQRPFILREIERATGLVGEIRAEGIAMVDRVGDLSDVHLPEAGTNGQLTLLLATWLADRLRRGATGPVAESELREETRRLIASHPHWRKDVREPGADVALTRDVVLRLCALGLARTAPGPAPAVQPLPAIGRFGLRADVPEPATAPPEELLLALD